MTSKKKKRGNISLNNDESCIKEWFIIFTYYNHPIPIIALNHDTSKIDKRNTLILILCQTKKTHNIHSSKL